MHWFNETLKRVNFSLLNLPRQNKGSEGGNSCITSAITSSSEIDFHLVPAKSSS